MDSSDDESSECDVYEERTMMIGDERVHIPTSILDYWDERRYAHQSVCRFDDSIGELTAEQIMEIQESKDKMVA